MLYKLKTSFHNEFIVNSQQLLYINIVIVVLLILYFVLGRSKVRGPVKLNFHKDAKNIDKQELLSKPQTSADFTQLIIDKDRQSKTEQVKPIEPTEPFVDPVAQARVVEELKPIKPAETEPEKPAPEKPAPEEPALQVSVKELPVAQKKERIFFVYNGHEWECHEVLGLTVGCTLQVATEMYQHLIKTSDPSTFEFYESAYKSILKKKSEKK